MRRLLSAVLLFAFVPILPAQEEGTPEEARLSELIRNLDSEEFEVRETATDSLLGWGPEIGDELEAIVANDPSPEVRIRLTHILQQFEREQIRASFTPGEEVEGCRALLLPKFGKIGEDGTIVLQAGEVLAFELEIQNVSSETRTISEIARIEYSLPNYRHSNSASELRVVAKRLNGSANRSSGARTTGGIHNRKTRDLAPGTSMSKTIALSARHIQASFTPGRYQIEVVYLSQSRKLIPDATTDMTSNSIEFEIARPQR